jgi:hypothetical protein
MRTTTTLDADLHERVEAFARSHRTTLRGAINLLLRRGLDAGDLAPAAPFRVVPHHAVFVPGVDPGRLNQLLDELEVDDFAAESATR